MGFYRDSAGSVGGGGGISEDRVNQLISVAVRAAREAVAEMLETTEFQGIASTTFAARSVEYPTDIVLVPAGDTPNGIEAGDYTFIIAVATSFVSSTHPNVRSLELGYRPVGGGGFTALASFANFEFGTLADQTFEFSVAEAVAGEVEFVLRWNITQNSGSDSYSFRHVALRRTIPAISALAEGVLRTPVLNLLEELPEANPFHYRETFVADATGQDARLMNSAMSATHDLTTATGNEYVIDVLPLPTVVSNDILPGIPFATKWGGLADIKSAGAGSTGYVTVQQEFVHFAGTPDEFTTRRRYPFRLLNDYDDTIPLSSFDPPSSTLTEAQIGRLGDAPTQSIQMRLRFQLFSDQARSVARNWSDLTQMQVAFDRPGLQFSQLAPKRGPRGLQGVGPSPILGRKIFAQRTATRLGQRQNQDELYPDGSVGLPTRRGSENARIIQWGDSPLFSWGEDFAATFATEIGDRDTGTAIDLSDNVLLPGSQLVLGPGWYCFKIRLSINNVNQPDSAMSELNLYKVASGSDDLLEDVGIAQYFSAHRELTLVTWPIQVTAVAGEQFYVQIPSGGGGDAAWSASFGMEVEKIEEPAT